MNRKIFNGIDDGAANITAASDPDVPEIRIDFSLTAGKIKPLHGINNTPVIFGDPLPEL